MLLPLNKRKNSHTKHTKSAINSLTENSKFSMLKKVVKNKYFLIGLIVFIFVILLSSIIYYLSSNTEEVINDYDFTKGVLSLNTDKSEYLVGDTVLFQMGSLNKDGDTLCKSNLQLQITVPNKDKKTLLTYDKKQIVTTATCKEDNNVTNDPDYISRYKVEGEGEYKVLLTNLDTGKKVKSSFKVIKQNPQFNISRNSAPRINPFKSDRYPMVIYVSASKDFKGKYVEYAPKNFNFAWVGDAKITETKDFKALSWDIDIKAGETKKLTYEYTAPKKSPDFIRYGNGELVINTNVVYKETHAWQIASDATITTAGSGNWSSTTANAPWPSGTIPATTDTVVVANGHTLTVDGNRTVNNITINTGGTLTFSNSPTLTFGSTTSGVTFIANSGTYTRNGETITIAPTTPAGNQTITSGTVSLNNLNLNPNLGTARTYTLGAGLTVNGNFSSAPSGTGNVVLTINLSANLVVTGSVSIVGMASNQNRPTLDLTTSNRSLTAASISIGANSIFNARASTVTINGTSGTLFTRTGTFTQGTSTVVFSGNGSPTALTSGTVTFNNLTLSPTITTARTYPLGSGALTINGNFNINPTSSGANALTVEMGANVTVAATGTTTLTRTTSATSVLDVRPSTTDYNLSTGFLNIATGGTLDGTSSSATITLTGTSSTLWTNNGTFTQGTTVVTVTSASGTPILTAGSTSTTFYDLTLNSAATVINSGVAFTVSRNLTVSQGAFNSNAQITGPGSGSGTFTISGSSNFCLGGTTASTSNTCNSGATQTSAITMPTFQTYTFSTTSNVRYLSNAATSISSTPTYGNLYLMPTLTAARTYTLSTLSVAGTTFTVNPTAASSFALTVNVGADITLPTTTTLTLTGTTSGTSVLDVRPSSTDYNISTGLINIATAGTLDATSSSFTLTLTGTSGTLFTQTGNFNVGTSTVTFTPNINTTLTSGTITFYNLTFTPALSTTRTYTFGAGAITINGDFTSNPTGTGSLNIAMGGDITVGSSKNLTLGGSGATSYFQTGVGNPSLSTGFLTINSGSSLSGSSSSSIITLTANGTPFTRTGTYTPGSTTVVYNPVSTSGVTVASGSYYNITLNKASNTFSLTTSGITVTNDITITAGVLDSVSGSNYPIIVGRNWTNTPGTAGFLPQQGTVTFNTTVTAQITGDTNFYNFTATTANKTIQFGVGETFAISGLLTLTGNSTPTYVYLDSTDGSSQWNINYQGTESISYTNIKNSACDGSSQTITATTGGNVSGGNNGTCWSITEPVGLRAAYKFDEGTGTNANDSTGNNNTGILTGATVPTWQPKELCVSEKCLYFNGSTSKVTVSNDLNIKTVSFWVKPTNLTNTFMQLASGAYVSSNSSGVVSATGFTTPTIYIDGIQKNTIETNKWQQIQVVTSTNITATDIQFGAGNNGNTYYNGLMDEVRLYSNTLSSIEVKQQAVKRGTLENVSARVGTGSSDNIGSGVVGYYRMDEASYNGTTGEVLDSNKTTSNNGTATNATTSGGKYGKGGIFDGNGDYVTVTDSATLNPSNQVSVSAWVKSTDGFSTTAGVNQGLIDKGDYQLYFDKNDGKVKWSVKDSATKTVENLNPDFTSINGTVYDSIVWEGNLYISGSFSNAGGDPNADKIAMWDGNKWSWPAGQAPTGSLDTIYKLVVWNDELYVVGSFLDLGGDPEADCIAKWTGQYFTWDVAPGANSSSYFKDIVVYNNELVVTGNISNIGGDPDADIIASWNGSAFSWPTGMGASGSVNGLAVYDNKLIVLGSFSSFPATPVTECSGNICQWDGNNWSWVSGQTLSGYGVTAVPYNGYLYVCGVFNNAGGDADADAVAMWNGTAFSWPDGKGTGGGSACTGIDEIDGKIYLGGGVVLWNIAGDPDADYIAEWDPVTEAFSWPTGQGFQTNSDVKTFTKYDSKIIIGGTILGTSSDSSVRNIGVFDGNTVSNFSTTNTRLFNNTIKSTIQWGDDLYIAGDFTDGGGDSDCDYICKYDGTTFSWPSGQGLNGAVNALMLYNNKLYVGGNFTDAGGDSNADKIATWNGSAFSWTSGQGLGGEVYSLTSKGSKVYVGGNFTDAGGDADADYIAEWSGSAFSWPTDRGLNGIVRTMITINDTLYLGGSFTNGAVTPATDDDADYIATWDGTDIAWPSGRGLNGPLYALTYFRGQLWVGGSFTNGAVGATDGDCDNICVWTGTDFSMSTSNWLDGAVRSFVVNNGYLYVGGDFTDGAGGVYAGEADYIAELTGSSSYQWDNAQVSLSSAVYNLTPYKGSLIAAGTDLYKISSGNTNLVTSKTSNWAAGAWNYIAGTYDGSYFRIYINGILESVVYSPNISIRNSALDVLFGKSYGNHENNGSDEAFKGMLDEVKIYNRAISADEIQYLYTTPPGPIAYWNLDENTGTSTIADSSGNGLTGDLQGSMTQANWVPGKYGSALNLDGSNDYVDVPDNGTLVPGSAISISTWVNFKDLSTTQRMVRKYCDGGVCSDGSSYYLEMNNTTAYLRFGVHLNGNLVYVKTANNIVTANTWYYVTGIYDSVAGTIKIYLNGVDVTSSTTGTPTGTIQGDTGSLRLGAHTSTGNLVNGALDDIKIYNYPISRSKIIEDMNGGHPLGGSPLASQIGYWKMDSLNGSTLYDSSSYGNNLTIVGTPTIINSGKYDKALDLEKDSSQYALITDNASLSLTGSLTLSTWIKPESVTTSTLFPIAGKWSGSAQSYMLAQYGDEIRLYIDSSSNYVTTNTANLQTGTWYQVIGVYNATAATAKIYINGTEYDTTVSGTIPYSIGDATDSFNIGIDELGTTVNYQVDSSSTNNDGEWYNGTYYPDELFFGRYSSIDDYTVTRFTGVAVAQGTTISSATFALTSFATDSSCTNYSQVQAENVNSGQVPGNSNPAGWSLTTESANYTRASWSAGTSYSTDATSVVQAIINRAGWVSGNNLNLITHNLSNGATCSFQAYDYADDPTKAATLSITYGSGTLHYYDGVIDEVKLYNDALTPAQIKVELLRGKSVSFGSISTTSTGVADNSTTRKYCVPGDSSTCTGPVLDVNFDENSGTLLHDGSGNGNDCTATSQVSPSFVPGKLGSAYNFQPGPGTANNDDLASCGSASNLDNIFSGGGTISFWVNPNGTAGNHIINKSDVYQISSSSAFGTDALEIFYQYSGDDARWYVDNALTAGTWAYITVTMDSTSTSLPKVYVNGVEKTVSTWSTPTGSGADDSSGTFYIGGNPNYEYSADSLIDNLLVYDYTRSASQIAWDYNKGKPTAWFKLDECTGTTINDSMGNITSGTLTLGAGGITSAGTCTSAGSTAWYNGATGKVNSSLSFDGTDDYVDFNDVLDFKYTDSRTFTAWINPSTISGQERHILSKINQSSPYDGWRVYLRSDLEGALGFDYVTSWATNSLAVYAVDDVFTTGTWQHLAVVYSNNTVKFYKNGKEMPTQGVIYNSLSSSIDNTKSFNIGSRDDGAGSEYEGQIDDVRIFNFALSPQQIKDVYNNGAASFK